MVEQSGHSGEALYNILSAALSKRGGTERPGALYERLKKLEGPRLG